MTQPDPADARKLRLEVVKTYAFECATEEEARSLVKRVHLRGMGRQTRALAHSQHAAVTERGVWVREQLAKQTARRDALLAEVEALERRLDGERREGEDRQRRVLHTKS